MENYRPLSACALIDGVSELEKFFDNYKNDIIATIRGSASAAGSTARNSRVASRNSNSRLSAGGVRSPSPSSNNQSNNNNTDGSRRFSSSNIIPQLENNDDDHHNHSQQQHDYDNNNQYDDEQNNANNNNANNSTVTARAMYHSQTDNQALTEKLFGSTHGVLDVVHHLFTRHGTSHTLFDAIEHLNLLIPNWHEPRKNNDGSLLETPEMRIYAMRSMMTTNDDEEENSNNNKNNSSKNQKPSSASRSPLRAGARAAASWRSQYTVADICELTGLKNDPTVVRLLERDRGFGTKLWKVQHPLEEDGAPPTERKPGFGDPLAKKPYGWRSRIKFATALRAIQDRSFVADDAREAMRDLEQLDLPNCSFEPHDLIAMSNALTNKLELEADRATKEEMIQDLHQQIRAIETFVRSLETDLEKYSNEGEMALLKSSAVQQIEWYERLLRAVENQFDVAIDDAKGVEIARKERNWNIFRQAKGDLPCVQSKIKARIGRLQSAASKIRDLMRERAMTYEKDLERLDDEISRSTTNCTSHLEGLQESWEEMIEAIKKASAAEKKFCEMGASLRNTVEDRLNLIGARAMKDNSHSSMLKSANDVLLDLAEEMNRLNNSTSFLSDLHKIVCSGSDNVTEQYDRRREELLTQAEKIHQDHEQWINEYSVALGRHRHRVSSKLSDAQELERKSEMRRELASDLLDYQARAYAQYRDEAATEKVKVKTELAALDGSFHARNEQFKRQAVQLNNLRNFVEELMQQSYDSRPTKGALLDNDPINEEKRKELDKKFEDLRKRNRATAKDPNADHSAVDLVNLTSQHHMEKQLRNRFEFAGHSREEQAAREVLWEKDNITQAKDASRIARRVPLPTTSTASSPPPFLSPAPPRQPGAAASSITNPNENHFARPAFTRPRTAGPTSSSSSSATIRNKNNNGNENNIDTNNDGSDNITIANRNQKQQITTTTRPQTASGNSNIGRSRLGQKTSAGQVMRVVYPFKPRVEDELKLDRGDTVIVLRQGDDDGWAFGVSHDRMGQFPLNYVEPVPY